MDMNLTEIIFLLDRSGSMGGLRVIPSEDSMLLLRNRSS